MVPEGLIDAFPEIQSIASKRLTPAGLEVTVVPIKPSVDESLAGIPKNAEAVALLYTDALTATMVADLANGFIQRGLPSFTFGDRTQVEGGFLATSVGQRNLDRVTRRVAVNLLNILQGEEAGGLPIEVQIEEWLTINMRTAGALGLDPPFPVLTGADLLYADEQPGGRQLSLSMAVREASRMNLDLAAANLRVESGLQSVRLAKSPLLPHGVGASLQAIDKDSAESSLGTLGQGRLDAFGNFSQLIYSERARANYDIEKDIQVAREEDRNELRLDVIQDAASTYLNLLRAKSVERVQRSNFQLTRTNLNLARSRVELGSANRDELFRWESELASNLAQVVDANAGVRQSQIAVNRVLNRPIEEPFQTIETSIDDLELVTSFSGLEPYIRSARRLRAFRDFMAAEAFSLSPELRQLDAVILGKERTVLAAKRRFYIPDVGVDAGVDTFFNFGAGSEPPPIFPDTPDSLQWSVALTATLPIFEGGALRAERSQAAIDLQALNAERDATQQFIEERIRSLIFEAGASFMNIQFKRQSADAARQNLDLVQDSYSEGRVGIVNLLDAQEKALNAELLAANAVYDYLLDLNAVQRSVGRFDHFRSAQDRQEFLNRLGKYFEGVGF